MKYRNIFRLLAVTVTLALMVAFLPVAPVFAAESLVVSPDRGEIGDKPTVSGSDYDPGVTVYIFFSGEELDEGDDIEDLTVYERKITASGLLGELNEGEIIYDFKIPDVLEDGDEEEAVSAGEYLFYTTYSTTGNIQAVGTFVVTGITQISPTSGTVSTEVDIRGVGFEDDEEIEVFYDGDEITIESGDDETDGDGQFNLTIEIPESPAGEHTISIDIKNDTAEAEFTVEPEMSISVTSGKIGDTVTVSGTGFGDSVDVTVTFGGEAVATGNTNSAGTFSISFDVPSVAAGTYDVVVTDDDDNSGEAEFSLSTDVDVSPVTSQGSPGYVGMDMTISGSGFIPEHEITITYASTPVVYTTTSEADGSFSYTFQIPESESGDHTITATDGVNSLEVGFFMEAQAPAIPQPLLPELDTRPEQPVLFDWGDVTDPSGVTYTLQVATDSDFTALLILEQTGLTASEYAMTEEDGELEKTQKDAPYYWRVRAIDNAGNASGWTGAASFEIGFIFSMPNWAIYLLIAVGGVLLFFVGFFVGRRTGYYEY
ncbi:IPT/TIG domain-containing protein [Chloroflexota bacterium]